MEMGRMSDGPPSAGGRSLSSAKLKESCANLHLFHSRSRACAPPLSVLWIYGFPLDFQRATHVAGTMTTRSINRLLARARPAPPECRSLFFPLQGAWGARRTQPLLTIRVHPDLGR